MKLFRILIVLALLICLAPLISIAVAGWIARSHGCTLHEGFVNPCVINGKDYGETLYQMGVMGWLMLASIPIAAGLILLWIAVEIAIAIHSRKTKTGTQ
mgnify:CR=1 FL=1